MGDGKKELMTKVELMHDDYKEHLAETIEKTDECVIQITNQINRLTNVRDTLHELKVRLQLEYPE